jgi:cytochrome c6
MKRTLAGAITAAAVFSFTALGVAEDKATSGEELFKKHCAVCHPDGSNIVNPKKTLHKKDREVNNIKNPEDIVKTMRNPGPGMTPFNKSTIPDNDAKKIAEYILKTFK